MKPGGGARDAAGGSMMRIRTCRSVNNAAQLAGRGRHLQQSIEGGATNVGHRCPDSLALTFGHEAKQPRRQKLVLPARQGAASTAAASLGSARAASIPPMKP
jgi:hypothetical protein